LKITKFGVSLTKKTSFLRNEHFFIFPPFSFRLTFLFCLPDREELKEHKGFPRTSNFFEEKEKEINKCQKKKKKEKNCQI
jgi:hypothetical protein